MSRTAAARRRRPELLPAHPHLMAALGRSTSAPVPAPAFAAPPPHANLLKSVRQSRAYAPQHEPRVAFDVHQAVLHYPSLHAILDFFTSSDGSSTPLVALRGTVPVRYKGSFYKIPVHLWVMPYHPAGPPLAFVVPTRAMVFRKGHPHVDVQNGLVYLPYLSEWSPERSSVLGVVHALVKAFEAKPPVYAKMPAALRLGDAERANLVDNISKKVHAALIEMGSRRLRDVALARDASGKLLHARQVQLTAAEEVRASLNDRLAELSRAAASLKRWATLHPVGRGGSVDEETRPRHVVREQELVCRARDAALTDAMDVADEAVGKRVVRAEEYVRAVRWMAREQFFERVMLGKARRRLGVLKETAKKRKAEEEGKDAGNARR